jgi:hypothetical protein
MGYGHFQKYFSYIVTVRFIDGENGKNYNEIKQDIKDLTPVRGQD